MTKPKTLILRASPSRPACATDQRRIIAVLSKADDHPDVEEVYRRASAKDSGISIATVYRTVRLFEEAGILTGMISAMAGRAMSRWPKTITT